MLISHPFVMSSFGSEWSPTAEILLILAPVGMLQTVGSTVGSIYQARGRTDWMFGWGVFAGIVRTLAFMIGLRWGIVGVSAAYAISTFILWYPGYAIPFRLIDLKVLDLIKAIWIPMKYSFLMVGGVISLRLLLSWNRIMNSWIILFSSILIGMAIYIGLLLNRKPLIFRELVGTLPIKDSSFLRGISGSKIQ
jgi:O-antigen/teichoic acid export membrane protein